MRKQEDILEIMWILAKEDKDKPLMDACRRDRNRLLRGANIIYTRIHGLVPVKYKYQPDPVVYVPFAVDLIADGKRTITVFDEEYELPPWKDAVRRNRKPLTGRDLGVD